MYPTGEDRHSSSAIETRAQQQRQVGSRQRQPVKRPKQTDRYPGQTQGQERHRYPESQTLDSKAELWVWLVCLRVVKEVRGRHLQTLSTWEKSPVFVADSSLRSSISLGFHSP